MVKLDYPPLLEKGHKTIGVWQLDEFFLKPFQDTIVDTARRRDLIRNLNLYLRELRKLQIPIEIWLDGSFTTKHPEPQDIDLIVWVDSNDVNTLPENLQVLFNRIVSSRDWIKLQYNVDVYLGEKGSEIDEVKYTKWFSSGHLSFSVKGFFKLILTDV
ncbi:hypothetical protein [Larkinella sp. C7]|uniref:DUF6932 family protein n=1 Tax=Larkinella sp. C7 TaxID=2576607 RepID=UPI0011111BE9|nr:hypothetical protein [Larkinella sp. C7]